MFEVHIGWWSARKEADSGTCTHTINMPHDKHVHMRCCHVVRDGDCHWDIVQAPLAWLGCEANHARWLAGAWSLHVTTVFGSARFLEPIQATAIAAPWIAHHAADEMNRTHPQ
jgi:hypothetical protein